MPVVSLWHFNGAALSSEELRCQQRLSTAHIPRGNRWLPTVCPVKPEEEKTLAVKEKEGPCLLVSMQLQ